MLHTLSCIVSNPKGAEDLGSWREGKRTELNLPNSLNNCDIQGLPVKVCTTFLPFSAVVREILPCSEPLLEVTGTLLSVFHLYCHFLSAAETIWDGQDFRFSVHLSHSAMLIQNAGNKSLQCLQ